MNKSKTARIAGFVVALCASGGLIAAATQGTGAYFSDSHGGTLTASTGHLTVHTEGTTLNFAGLVPGVYTSKKITYTPTTGSPNEDVWMVFDTNTQAYGKFTGTNHVSYNGYTDGGLGGFGHFQVLSSQGLGFQSYNLQVAGSGQPSCHIDGNGDGGSSAKATGPDNGSQAAAECGVPGAIKIGSNIPAGVTGTAAVTFGVTGKWTAQNSPVITVPFQIVATQVGVSPTAQNF